MEEGGMTGTVGDAHCGQGRGEGVDVLERTGRFKNGHGQRESEMAMRMKMMEGPFPGRERELSAL
jgi:hypothetical protein